MKKLMFVAMLLVTFNLVFIGVNAEELVWGDYIYKLNGEYSSDKLQDGISITEYNGTESIVIIPSEIDGQQVKRIYFRAFLENEYVQEVYISEGIEIIDANAFYHCANLKKVQFPTTLKYIGSEAFKWCSLEKIVIPEGVETIRSRAFGSCESLEHVVIPNSVDVLYPGIFYGSDNIESIVFYNPNTEIQEPRPYESKGTNYPADRKEPEFPVFSRGVPKTIYSFAGGSIEAYARENNIRFIPIANVVVDDIKLYNDMPPYIKNDRTLVPMRAIFEALGAEVSWNNETRTATGVKGGIEVKITIGENVLYKNGEAIELDCVAEITNDRTMVPVRAIGEAFGCTVN